MCDENKFVCKAKRSCIRYEWVLNKIVFLSDANG
jgi:hypothetical protein